MPGVLYIFDSLSDWEGEKIRAPKGKTRLLRKEWKKGINKQSGIRCFWHDGAL